MPGYRIVAIDYDAQIGARLREALAPPEFDFHWFGSGRDALAALPGLQPSAIICDVMLPDIEGQALIEEVKRSAALRDVPFLILSGVRSQATIQATLDAGAEAFLLKPFPVAKLVKTLREILWEVDQRAAAPPFVDPGRTGGSRAAPLTLGRRDVASGLHAVPSARDVAGRPGIGVETPGAPPEPARSEVPSLATPPVREALLQPDTPAPVRDTGEGEAAPIRLEGRFSSMDRDGARIRVVTEVDTNRALVVRTTVTRDGGELRRIETKCDPPPAPGDEERTVRELIDFQHARAVEEVWNLRAPAARPQAGPQPVEQPPTTQAPAIATAGPSAVAPPTETIASVGEAAPTAPAAHVPAPMEILPAETELEEPAPAAPLGPAHAALATGERVEGDEPASVEPPSAEPERVPRRSKRRSGVAARRSRTSIPEPAAEMGEASAAPVSLDSVVLKHTREVDPAPPAPDPVPESELPVFVAASAPRTTDAAVRRAWLGTAAALIVIGSVYLFSARLRGTSAVRTPASPPFTSARVGDGKPPGASSSTEKAGDAPPVATTTAERPDDRGPVSTTPDEKASEQPRDLNRPEPLPRASGAAPRLLQARRDWARSLYEAGRYGDAYMAVLEVLKLAPSDPEAVALEKQIQRAMLAAREPADTQPAPPERAVPPAALVELGQPGFVAPVVESRPKLVYPPQALQQGWEARIGLRVLVDEAGKVADAQIVSDAAGTLGFTEAAVAYVKTWTFRPATKDGVPVKAWLRVDVDFRLPR